MKNLKKNLGLLLALVLILSLTACAGLSSNLSSESAGQNTEESQESTSSVAGSENQISSGGPKETQEQTQSAEQTVSGGTLVIYFSRTGEQYSVGVIDKGNTAIVAEMIAEQTGADLCEVLPADDHYPMTYNELTDVAKQEQNDGARPEYAGELPDIAQYDAVFIGAPVWWGDWPMMMYTVFENNDFSGKKLAPFSTHEGSGLSGFDRKLKSACPDSEVLDGLAIRGSDAQNKPDSVRSSVNDWLSGLGY